MLTFRQFTEGLRDTDTALRVMVRANKIKKTVYNDNPFGSVNQIKVRPRAKSQMGAFKLTDKHIDDTISSPHDEVKTERIPINRIGTKQKKVNSAVIGAKMQDRWDEYSDKPIAMKIPHFYGKDDHHYELIDGNHKTEKAKYKGEKHIDAYTKEIKPTVYLRIKRAINHLKNK